ncbi:hypothetical protein J2797_005643 [Paraburkholderia terricola]|jgi:hypothetical protein|uniref:Transcription regulator AsnC/Lrp ligand binding domain-containing protein n=1 Tax=Paraburkholderia terricola TaxID=169427 RepID=A0ABU1M2R6_9BURK|nr:hypothetical protein [Paraburkholderia terricola]MDR6450091.1 hypothetical protein [Paraburkholderia terricola]MDR6484871.1 hypothetical protein [Paraburkholderia terricola]MDR6495719.1 hypothetical protein [Paraburkholderia terricola]
MTERARRLPPIVDDPGGGVECTKMADQRPKTERDAKGMSRPKGASGSGYRVSPGPDFVVVAEVLDMPEYDELARRLFRSSANIRNVRTFFSTRRAKFEANARVRSTAGKTR